MKKLLFTILSLWAVEVWAKATKTDDWQDYTTLAIEWNTEFPEEWGNTKIVWMSGSNAELEAIKPDSPVRFNLGVYWGYDLIRPSHHKMFIFGPVLGVKYGFLRQFRVPEFNITLQEKYIHIPILARMKYEGELGDKKVALEVGLGYEWNVLLSAKYREQAVQNSVGFNSVSTANFVILPSPNYGSIVLYINLHAMGYFYIGSKINLPFTGNDRSTDKKFNTLKTIDRPITYIVPHFQLSLGTDLFKWM